MKKYILSTFFIFLLTVSPARASLEADFVKTNIGGNDFYPSFFDALVFDMVIPSNNGVADELNVLTFKNLGSAEQDKAITKAVVWQDQGPAGWQGLGVDEKIGNALWYDLDQYWYLKDLSVTIPAEGLRLFISLETNYSFSNNATVKIMIPLLKDIDGDGEFDLRDTGIFMKSDNDGPTDNILSNNVFQTIYKSSGFDFYDPKTNITNLFGEQEVTAGAFTIKGQSRDQGGSMVSEVTILIDGKEYAVNTTDGYAYWQYAADFSAGEHIIKVKHSDQIGNQGETAAISIEAIAAVSEPEQSLEPEIPAVAEISAGDLIKGSLPSVYYYGADGKRYVFPNEKTYQTWYNDFSTVKTISDAQLASIALGGNATYRPGVKMVKITTDPKVYAVAKGGVLRWVRTEAVAQSLYGANWREMVEDLPDAFFTNYTTGDAIEGLADYNPETVSNEVTTVAIDKRL